MGIRLKDYIPTHISLLSSGVNTVDTRKNILNSLEYGPPSAYDSVFPEQQGTFELKN